MMNLDRLRIFHVAARLRSFTAAAAELHLTQPGVSKHVKELERSCGHPLFERLGKTVVLTQAGEILAAASTDVFCRLADARQRLDDLGRGHGRLCVGASNSIGTCLLPELLAAFRQCHPHVELAIDIGLSEHIEGKLLDRTLDIGLLGHAPAHPSLEARMFADDRLVLAVPPGHPWARRRKPVVPAELADVPFLVSQPGSGTRRLVENLLAERGVALSRKQEMGSTEGVKKAIEAGLGVSLLSHCVVHREAAAGWLRCAPLADMPTKRSYYLAYRRDRYLPVAARAFAEFVLAHGQTATARRAISARARASSAQ
jgi:DNA-binding transcriptional LysR family regulator